MKLEAVTLGPYRQVGRVTIRTEQSVVLYGPNGAGKTTLLRALAGREAVPPATDCQSAPTFYLRLDEEDRPTLMRLLARGGVAPVFRAIAEAMRLEPDRLNFYNDLLDRETAAAQRTPEIALPDLSGVDEKERETAFVAALLGDVSAQGRALAEPFVWEMLLHPHIAVCESRVWLAAGPAMWSASNLVQIATSPALVDTWVQKVAQSLCAVDEPCPVVRLGSDPTLQPHVAWLDGTDGDLERELERLVPQLHDAYWGVRAGTAAAPALAWARTNTPHAAIDPWIEADDATAQGDGFAQAVLRPRLSLAPVLAHLEARIAKLVPFFVEAEGGVKLRLEPIPRWPSGRVRIVLAGPRPRTFASANLSAGARRWIAIATRAACHELLQSVPRRVLGKTGKEYVAQTRHDDVVALACRSEPVTDLQVRDFFAATDSILIVDEPETHLQSVSVRDVVDVIDALAPSHLATFVATHAPELINRAAHLHRIDIDNGTGRALARPLAAPLVAALREMSASVGLQLADVLGGSKAVVLVADKYDEFLVKHLFRTDLERHRALVLPLTSVDNAVAIAEGEFVFRTGVQLFALVDAARREALAGATGRVAESDPLLSLLRRVAGHDDLLKLVPFNAPDLLTALPETAVRRAFSKGEFRSWQALDTEWRARSGAPRNFKQFAIDRMKLTPTTESQFIGRVLQARQGDESPGSEVRGAMTVLLKQVDARPVVAVPPTREVDRRAEAARRAELERRAEEGRAEARRAEAAKRAEQEAERHAEAERRGQMEQRMQAAVQRANEAVQRAEAEAKRRADAENRAAAAAEQAADVVRRAETEAQARITTATAEAEARARAATEQAAQAVRRAEAEAQARAKAEAERAAETERRTAAESAAAVEAGRRTETERRIAAEEKLRAEAETRLAAEAKARGIAEQRAEAEVKARTDTERRVEAEAKRRAEVESRLAAEAKARAAAEERAEAEIKARLAADRRLATEVERRTAAERQLEEEAQRYALLERRAEAEVTRRVDIELGRRAELARRAELNVRAPVQRRAPEPERRGPTDAERAAEEKRRAEAELQRRAEAEVDRRAEMERRAEEQRRAEADAAEAARRAKADAKREADAKRRVEADAKRRAEAEADAKRRADAAAEAKRRADADAKAEAKRRADAEAEAKRRAQEPKPKTPTKVSELSSLWESVDLFPPADELPDW